MAYSVQTLLSDLGSVIHGTTTNKVPNIYGHINRAARSVLLDVDPKETQRILQLAPVFNNVFDYPAPADLKGDRIIDIRPTAGRTADEIFNQDYSTDFDANKAVSTDKKLYTQWNTGIKTLRIEAPFLTAPVSLADTSTTTGWSVSGGVQSLSLDTVNNPAGGGDLTFNLAAGQSTGYLEKSTLSPIDLTSYLNLSYGFLWVYLPTGSAVSAIDVRWGTDSSNFYSLTVTQTAQGTTFQNAWNLIALPWTSASTTGTPTLSNTKYARVSFTYNSQLQTGAKICSFTFGLSNIFSLVYYSKFLFRDPSTNAFQETITDSTDNAKLINLDTESYNLLFNKSAYFIAQSLQGADAGYDAQFWDNEYKTALTRYIAQNPSEAMVKGSRYYSVPRKGYRL